MRITLRFAGEVYEACRKKKAIVVCADYQVIPWSLVTQKRRRIYLEFIKEAAKRLK